MNRLRNIRRLDSLPCPPKWVPTLGQLQKTLQKGEYLPLRPLPMFESDFVQVTSQGAPVYVHHKTNHLTMGVAASLPGPVLPDLLLLAQPSESRDCTNLILTRMIPLDLVHLYVHNLSAWRLKLRLITGRYYYLELDAPDSEVAFLFDRWIRLINLLREPANFWAPKTLKTPLTELAAQVAPPASTWRLKDQSHTRCSAMTVDPCMPYKTRTSQKQRKAKTTVKRRFKSQAVGDSVPLLWSQLEHTGAGGKATEKTPPPDLGFHRSRTNIRISEKPTVTIRTIFSIFSRTFSQMLSSSKAAICWGPDPGVRGRRGPESLDPRGSLPDSDGAMVPDGFFEIPSHPMWENSPAVSSPGSYSPLDMQGNVGDLRDPESSTLSSHSVHQAPYSASIYLHDLYSSIPGHNEKATPLCSVQRLQPPPSQKTPSVPATLAINKAPLVLDQSQRTPVLASVPQKAPVIPGASRKTPRALASPQKAVSRPVPNQKPLSPPQKALTTRTQYQMTLGPASLGTWPVESPIRNVPERSQPEGKKELVLVVGAQETKVMGMRDQKVARGPPFNTTRKELKGAVIGKTQEITVDGLKAKLHRMKEEKSLDVPVFKSKVKRQQQKLVKTRELATEGVSQERRRPFSVEELPFAKMMIVASSTEVSLGPELVGLPSWLLSTHMLATSTKVPDLPHASQVATPQRMPVVVREQLWQGPWAKGSTGMWVEETSHPWAEVKAEKLPSDWKGPSREHPHFQHAPGSPKVDRVSQVPIALPETRWEDVQSPVSLTPVSKMKARVSQMPNRESQETVGTSGQGPLAKTEPSLKSLIPKLLKIETLRDMANKLKTKKKQHPARFPEPSVARYGNLISVANVSRGARRGQAPGAMWLYGKK
ncbi:Golgi-associated RAB2 interactor protein 5B [Saccopteryx leptura]|uniref:Golgi-associated RAB2 interactor protein 5B n=1 Tax=Saccopteryx leptura TaxID=249018 RepID=UPI00339CC84B